jgi:RNA-binding protein FUS
MAFNPNTLSFDVPDTDTVYISGLPPDATEASVAAHFGTIGVVKDDRKRGGKRVWLYRDKATGALKGDGTVQYEDPFSAASAVEWFNGKPFPAAGAAAAAAGKKGGGSGGGKEGEDKGDQEEGGGTAGGAIITVSLAQARAPAPDQWGGGGGGGGGG